MFLDFVCSMVVDGFLRNGDMMVIENVLIQRYHELAVLEEILWILLLVLDIRGII